MRSGLWPILGKEDRTNMVTAIKSDPLPLRLDPSGTIYVGNTRVMLELVVAAYLDGASPEDIVGMWDTLDLGDVHSVLGYYLHHKDEIDKYVQQQREHAEEVRQKIEAWQKSNGFDQAGLRERLLARLANKSNE
jgi:uncharacterized protein (DUF433 family)